MTLPPDQDIDPMHQALPTREKAPTAGKGLLFIIFIAIVLTGLGAFAMTLRSEEGPKVAVSAPVPISAQVAPVRLQSDFDMRETYTGLITARRSSQLGFTQGGRIDRLGADIGDRVSRGSILATLDVRSLSASLAAAEANIAEVIASRDLALTSLARQKSLRDDGFVSQQIVDEFEAQAASAEARLAATRAQADTLRVQIDLARITAPFDGVITERMADEGVIAGPGQPIFELVEAGQLEARIGVPNASLASLSAGEIYALEVDNRSIYARLRANTGVIQARQRTVTAVFDIEPDQEVAIGSVARLPLMRDVEERGFWVPVSGLAEAERGLWSVLVATPEDGGWIAAPRLVEVVHVGGASAFVRGALSDGDRIVVDGLQRLSPGQPITPVDVVDRDNLAGVPATPAN